MPNCQTHECLTIAKSTKCSDVRLYGQEHFDGSRSSGETGGMRCLWDRMPADLFESLLVKDRDRLTTEAD